MMEPVTLPTGRPENPGLDYAFLKAEGTRIVQERAGKTWTDYNESDPGVTTLEQLCYALTELSYRAEFSVADLLVGRPGGEIDPRRQALYPARDIFPVNPVTPDDYRRLLIDRVPKVANAWVTPYRPSPDSPRGVNGLYDIYLYAPGVDPPCNQADAGRVVEAARRVYCAHRGLCEDVRSIVLLGPAPVVVHAEVSIAAGAVPDDVMARLLFRLGDFFAPEPRRHSLDQLVRDGMPPSEIFEGPLPLNGFILDAELQPRATDIPVQEVVRTVVGTTGVTAVRKLSVAAGGRTYRGDESVPVPRDSILRLETRQARGTASIRLYCNGVEVRTDPAVVKRKLDRLWERHRRSWPLADEYPELFGMPAGEFRDVRRYYSIQNQYPATYGINAYGLPADASLTRRGQAKQLKGYLLPFEQLMADFLAQLAHARDLFSTLGPEDPDGRRSYWYQYLDRDVPNVEPLLATGPDGYHAGLRRIVDSSDPWVERRAHFLAFLLALYADGLDAGSVAGAGGDACGGGDDAERERSLYRARLELIRRVVESTRDRGRAFDYLRRPSPGNVAGMELRSRIQLGMPVDDRRPLLQVLEEAGVELRPRAPGDEDVGALEWHADHIESAFEFITPPPFGAPVGPGPAGMGGLARVLPEELLDAEPGPGDLRVGSVPGDAAVSAVSRAGRGWRLLGRYPNHQAATDAGREFAGVLRHLRRHARQLYIVEHLLLRPGRYRGGRARAAAPGGDPDFEYGQALTAVFFLPRRLLDDESYRAFAEEAIRANAPAHLAVECCFLSSARGVEFEGLYRAWQQALESGPRARLRAAAARLRDFLRGCREAAEAPPRRRGEG